VTFVGASSILARLEAGPLSLTGGRVFAFWGAKASYLDIQNSSYLWRYLWQELSRLSNIKALCHRKNAAHNGLVAGSSPAGPTTFQALSAYCLPVLFHSRSRFAVCICGKLWRGGARHPVGRLGEDRFHLIGVWVVIFWPVAKPMIFVILIRRIPPVSFSIYVIEYFASWIPSWRTPVSICDKIGVCYPPSVAIFID